VFSLDPIAIRLISSAADRVITLCARTALVSPARPLNCAFANMGKHTSYFWRCLQRAFLIAPVLLAACCPGSRFSGDGKIASETCWPFSNYSVTFAPLSTATAESRKYSIHTLPDLDSVVGLRVTTPLSSSASASNCSSLPFSASSSFSVRASETVIPAYFAFQL
jgi:hypothetical protein